MINEAFWFFYMVGIVDGLSAVFIVGAILSACVTIYSLLCASIDGYDMTKVFKWCVPGVVLLTLLAIAVPPKEALYAGAGQYIAEAGELDQTLLGLKDLLDQKIAELSESE